jgi:polyisoprenoid-binding protein YceI
MKRYLPLAALLLAVGCNNAISPVAPTPNAVDAADATAVATIGEGGVVKLTGANTKIAFVGTRHDSSFKSVEGSIKMLLMTPGKSPPEDAANVSNINVEIDTDSLVADDPKLTTDLKGPDFLNVKEFPKATFKSTKTTGERGKDQDAMITGDLTLHGVTKSVTFPVHFAREKGEFLLTGSFKINRKDFKMTAGEGKADDLTISVTVGNPKK